MEIAGGTVCETCAWPTVAVVSAQKTCTATLIHPEVALYAAHCGSGFSSVRFGDSISGGQAQATEFCMTNPGYANVPDDQEHDWAFCKLAGPVSLPITPIMFGCELDELTVGRDVALVGYGETLTESAGPKRWVMTTISRVQEMAIELGGGGVGNCMGDSGGPALVKLSDGTWRTAGISSTTTGACGGLGTYGRTDATVTWVEENSGVDVTPCFEQDGTWSPTQECGGFYAATAGDGYGTWSNGCQGTPAGDASAMCGAPFNSEPDEDPPSVTITSPEDGTRYDDVPATIDITVDADDGDGWGIREVDLEIDGEVQATDTAAPWAFEGVIFPEGQWTLRAVATDKADNVADSDAVGIGVGVDPPPPQDDGGDDGGDDDGGDTGGDDGGDDGYVPGDFGGDSDRDGCGCSSTNQAALHTAWLVLVLGLVRRRRRR
jgi:MYXO-CTERM domain-containing protein